MKKQLMGCAALLALSLGAVTTAHAQYTTNYAPGVPPQHVIAIVRSTGMTPVSRPIRRGPNYVLIASDRSGAQMRVVLDAYDGAILRVRPVVAIQPYRAPYGAGAMDPYAPRPRVAIIPPEIKDPPPDAYGPEPRGPHARVEHEPLPPRGAPNPRVATAPAAAPHAPAAHPAPTPLPRPRPAVAANEVTGTTPAPSVPPTVKPVGEGAWPVPAKSEAGEPKSSELKMVPVAPLD